MFQKVLINDDHDAILNSVYQVLQKLNVQTIQPTQYCDEAFLKIKRGDLEENNYELLITDLSFKKDHRNINIATGEELIEKLRYEYPEMQIIVYSMKDQLQKVRQLFKKHKINGYVCKDRKGSVELEKAIKSVYEGGGYLSPQVANALNPKVDLEIGDYDIYLLKLLSKGLSQDEISEALKLDNITPNSLSSIEKHLNKLRLQFKANNAIHLVVTAKDLGLI